MKFRCQRCRFTLPVSHSLSQRVQGRGVDFSPDVDVDGRRVPGGGRHHRDALPHPRLPLDVRHTGHYLIGRVSWTSVTCHQAECWVMTLCPMLLRLFSLRDWPVVPAVAGDWALVAGPGALSSLSLSLSRPRHSAHITHTGDRASIETPEREVISEDIRPVLYFATHIST